MRRPTRTRNADDQAGLLSRSRATAAVKPGSPGSYQPTTDTLAARIVFDGQRAADVEVLRNNMLDSHDNRDRSGCGAL
jgi:hypothetical protein